MPELVGESDLSVYANCGETVREAMTGVLVVCCVCQTVVPTDLSAFSFSCAGFEFGFSPKVAGGLAVWLFWARL